MSLTVVNKIRGYRIDGNQTGRDDQYMHVRSHWLDPELIVVEILGVYGGHSHQIAVRAEDLRMAIENAVNAH